MGKRGGARVLYVYWSAATPLYLLLAYAKSRKENVTPADRKWLREAVVRIKRAYR